MSKPTAWVYQVGCHCNDHCIFNVKFGLISIKHGVIMKEEIHSKYFARQQKMLSRAYPYFD